MSSLILASTSPQRKQLLESLGLTFEIVPSAVDEDAHPEQNPAQRAPTLARLKAEDVAIQKQGCFVLGADTLVVSAAGTLLEKPKDEEEARAMLEEQSGATSVVHSALCLIDPKGELYEGLNSSSVTFKKLSTAEIDWWISTNLWQGRSGGFQIDGLGQLMIEKIEGDWTGIVGLPVFLFGELAHKAGFPVVFHTA